MTEGRPPLYVRRPFVAGLVRQLPLLAVLAAVAVGLVLVAVEHWRRGLTVMGLALVGAALRSWQRGCLLAETVKLCGPNGQSLRMQGGRSPSGSERIFAFCTLESPTITAPLEPDLGLDHAGAVRCSREFSASTGTV